MSHAIAPSVGMIPHVGASASSRMAAHAQALTLTPPIRSVVRKALLSALLLGVVPLAHAQFDKTPWPRSQALPQIDVVDVQGQHWTRAKLKGRVVVLNFWATWCGPCKEEMPSLQALHNADGVPPVVIGINVKETASTVRRFANAQGLTFPLVLDPQGEITRRWGVRVYPTTVLIDTDGQARWRVVGEVDWSGAEAAAWLSALQKPAISTQR